MKNSRHPWLRKVGGFSLLEVLVVLVIISIIISFATMSLDTSPEKLANEGQRLTALMKLAAEEAIMSSREYRLQFTVNGYTFAKLSGGEWQEFDDGVFRTRQLPGDFTFDLTLGNEPVELPSLDDDETKKTAAILFLSSGEVTPFELVIKSAGGKELVISNQSGVIEEEADRS
jgi:general secretion pathway protein H